MSPSFNVFFRKLAGPALSSLGLPVVPGRTIARDGRFFPKGALAFLVFSKPVFNSAGSPLPSSWVEQSHLVVDQDVGGAIRGGGHIDLYWGSGDEAKRSAGVIKQTGHLLYLVPNAKLREKLGV